jgi:uncharacterized RDD family membrane protein YckC
VTAPPATTGVGSQTFATRAGVFRRLAALLYEALIVCALVLIVGFALLPLVSPLHGDSLTVPALPARAFIFAVEFAILGFYFIFSWTRGRQTLAQRTWKLRLVTRDNAPLSPRAALERYVAAWIGPSLATLAYSMLSPHGLGPHGAWLLAFNFLWAAIDPERQFLHDRIAGTQVVTSV